MQAIRWILGRIILLVNFLTPPRGVQRSAEQQMQVDNEAKSLALYQYAACPFCVKVRRAFKRNSLTVETRDAKRSELFKQELLQGGGALKVPCLRIDENGTSRWMYESGEIISYLESRFAAPASVPA